MSRRPLTALHGLGVLLPALLLALGAPGRAAGQEGGQGDLSLGPLTAQEGAPTQRLGYTLTVEGAAPLPPGAFQAEIWNGYSNIFERDSSETHVLSEDFERLLTMVTLRYGVRRGLEVGARVGLEATWSGFLDGFIQDFHRRLGLNNPTREAVPTGSYGQELLDGGGTPVIDIPARHLDLDEIRLFAKWQLAGTTSGTVVSLLAETRIPPGRVQTPWERVDVALAGLARFPLGNWTLHGQIGASTLRTSPDQEPFTRSYQAFLVAGAEYRPRSGLAVIAEVLSSSPRLKGFDDTDVDGPLTNVVVGLKGRLGDGWVWELGFQEDIPPWGPSADFTAQLGITRRWGG